MNITLETINGRLVVTTDTEYLDNVTLWSGETMDEAPLSVIRALNAYVPEAL